MIVPECNSMGLSLLPGKAFEDILELTENKEIETLVVLENDLYEGQVKIQSMNSTKEAAE